MNKRQLFLLTKKFAKHFITYTIQDDCKIYRLKKTPLQIRYSLQKRFEKKWKNIPIQNNKIVFDNYMGSGYGCNGKYVTEQLLDHPARYHIVWVVKNATKRRSQFPEEIELVEYLSEEAFRAYASAKIWVCNYHLIAYFNRGLQKKDEQSYLQLWHGSFGIKKIEGDCPSLTKDPNWLYLAKKNSYSTDYWISNSRFETAVYRHAFWKPASILEYGHPRNDLFFRERHPITAKVRHSLSIPAESKILLYVPTFRDTQSHPIHELDIPSLFPRLEETFGGSWTFLMRLHPRSAPSNPELKDHDDRIIDASFYPDIQELLAAADIVITDYSSCIFDFLLTRRPAFVYAPDLDEYIQMRGFYYPLCETPFLIAHNTEELLENITNFQDTCYRQKVSQFLLQKGSVEDGKASLRVRHLIDQIMG